MRYNHEMIALPIATDKSIKPRDTQSHETLQMETVVATPASEKEESLGLNTEQIGYTLLTLLFPLWRRHYYLSIRTSSIS